MGPEAELLTFVNSESNRVEVPLHLQLCCRHELHLNIPGYREDSNVNELISIDEILQITQSILPCGVECEVYLTTVLTPEKTGLDQHVAIYMIIYRGVSKPIVQETADSYRAQLESTLSNMFSLRQNKIGRTISRPIPYSTLRKLMSDFVRYNS